MNMQQALHRALEAEVFARPECDSNYAYRYHPHGKTMLIHVYGRNRWGVVQNDFWRTMSRRDVESEWILCDADGNAVDLSKPDGLTLKTLIA